jgi:tetratricopeptide (TPR) repeat protein
VPGLSRPLRNARLAAGVLFSAVLASGCSLLIPQTAELRDSWPAALPERAELGDVPFFPQEENECGPAALATTLSYAGIAVTPEDLVSQVYLPARQGTLQVEMLAAPRKYGIVSYRLAPRFEDVLREVAAGNPVIVLLDFGVWPVSIWHYAVVDGYDRATGEAILRSGRKRRLVIPLAVLEYLWRSSKYWSMVTLPPERIPATADEKEYAAALADMARVGGAQAAGKAYAAFLGRWPDDLAGSIGLANAHYALGELKEAEAVLRQALRRHPDSVPVLNNLAQTLSDEGRNEEALGLVDKALAIPGPYAAAAGETRATILRRIAASRH